ncbi:MAG TPA: DsbA family oxidoreductase [Miltoncostaeaceae bacterium]|nr:DsbA family oxidoreductase [Miltoncostaeaceae bacterium]
MVDDPITVEIWSDVACPWCYIGKRRFEAGCAAFAEADPARPGVTVRYRSFQLAPEMSTDFEGDDVAYLTARLGIGEDEVHRMRAQITAARAGEGLTLDFAAVHPTNTRDAHRLLHIAREAGVQERMKERLLRAYFSEGRNVGDRAVLAELAGEVGLDPGEVAATLAGDAWDAAVDVDIRRAAGLGIGGVPFYVIDGRYGLSGAQPVELFTQALERALADRGTPEE